MLISLIKTCKCKLVGQLLHSVLRNVFKQTIYIYVYGFLKIVLIVELERNNQTTIFKQTR
jgi:hypothetical protein